MWFCVCCLISCLIHELCIQLDDIGNNRRFEKSFEFGPSARRLCWCSNIMSVLFFFAPFFHFHSVAIFKWIISRTNVEIERYPYVFTKRLNVLKRRFNWLFYLIGFGLSFGPEYLVKFITYVRTLILMTTITMQTLPTLEGAAKCVIWHAILFMKFLSIRLCVCIERYKCNRYIDWQQVKISLISSLILYYSLFIERSHDFGDKIHDFRSVYISSSFTMHTQSWKSICVWRQKQSFWKEWCCFFLHVVPR